ncbi:MAG: hypothetical protein EA426_12430 [Spirochaetaceae bacterium]|nr:MAG: hypothetical protein EA426_12430 [Spirochaetaceae bacterium]
MRPHVLFITCDQLRADTLGCYGNTVCRTPNIDALSASGTRFTECHTAYPVCAPNRAALATGRYPSLNGVAENGIALPNDELYDLTADPECFVNLWDEPSAVDLKRNATDRLLALMAENRDPRHERVGAC